MKEDLPEDLPSVLSHSAKILALLLLFVGVLSAVFVIGIASGAATIWGLNALLALGIPYTMKTMVGAGVLYLLWATNFSQTFVPTRKKPEVVEKEE